VPKGLPEPILAKLRDAVEKALDDPAVRAKLEKIGGGVPPADMRGHDNMVKRVAYEVDTWTEIIKKAGGLPAEDQKK
jgi:tripartite-type tricarboxylate transporter receptor subunit TctC